MNSGQTPLSYLPLSRFIRTEQMIGVIELLFPETEVIEGYVFLSGRMCLNPEQRMEVAKRARCNPSNVGLEEVNSFNWIELDGFLSDEASDSQSELIMRTLHWSWQICLSQKYPNRQLAVRMMKPEETGGYLGLGFEQ